MGSSEITHGPNNIVIKLHLNEHGTTKGLFPERYMNKAMSIIESRHPRMNSFMTTTGKYLTMHRNPSNVKVNVEKIRDLPDSIDTVEAFDDRVNEVIVKQMNTPFIDNLQDTNVFRATLITNKVPSQKPIPDTLVMSLPQLLSDPLSSLSLVDEYLSYVRRLCNGEENIDVETLGVLLPCPMYYTKDCKYLSGFFKNRKYKSKIRQVRKGAYRIKPDHENKITSRPKYSNFKTISIPSEGVERLQQLAKSLDVSFTSVLTGISVVALRRVNIYSKAPSTTRKVICSTYDDIRKTLEPRLSNTHLGNVWGSIINSCNIDEDTVDLIKQIHDYNHEYVENNDLMRSHGIVDITFGFGELMYGVPFFSNPSLEITNMGKNNFSQSNIDYFGVDDVNMYFTSNRPSFFLSALTTPSGNMNINIQYISNLFDESTILSYRDQWNEEMNAILSK